MVASDYATTCHFLPSDAPRRKESPFGIRHSDFVIHACPAAIHGMGVGKTRAAIEYAWKHADDYRALLFISADPDKEQSTSTLQFAH